MSSSRDLLEMNTPEPLLYLGLEKKTTCSLVFVISDSGDRSQMLYLEGIQRPLPRQQLCSLFRKDIAANTNDRKTLHNI